MVSAFEAKTTVFTLTPTTDLPRCGHRAGDIDADATTVDGFPHTDIACRFKFGGDADSIGVAVAQFTLFIISPPAPQVARRVDSTKPMPSAFKKGDRGESCSKIGVAGARRGFIIADIIGVSPCELVACPPAIDAVIRMEDAGCLMACGHVDPCSPRVDVGQRIELFVITKVGFHSPLTTNTRVVDPPTGGLARIQ